MIEKCRGKKKAQHNSDESETFEMYNSEIKHLKAKNLLVSPNLSHVCRF